MTDTPRTDGWVAYKEAVGGMTCVNAVWWARKLERELADLERNLQARRSLNDELRKENTELREYADRDRLAKESIPIEWLIAYHRDRESNSVKALVEQWRKEKGGE